MRGQKVGDKDKKQIKRVKVDKEDKTMRLKTRKNELLKLRKKYGQTKLTIVQK